MIKKLISRDDLEYIQAVNEGYEGWLQLSSGKTVYVSRPRCTAKEAGNAMKKVLDRVNITK